MDHAIDGIIAISEAKDSNYVNSLMDQMIGLDYLQRTKAMNEILKSSRFQVTEAKKVQYQQTLLSCLSTFCAYSQTLLNKDLFNRLASSEIDELTELRQTFQEQKRGMAPDDEAHSLQKKMKK